MWESLRAPTKRFLLVNSFHQLRLSPRCWNQSSGGSRQINTNQDFIQAQRSCQTPQTVREAPLCQALGGAEPSGAPWATSWDEEAPQLDEDEHGWGWRSFQQLPAWRRSQGGHAQLVGMGQPFCKSPLLDVDISIPIFPLQVSKSSFSPRKTSYPKPIPVFSASKAASEHPTHPPIMISQLKPIFLSLHFFINLENFPEFFYAVEPRGKSLFFPLKLPIFEPGLFITSEAEEGPGQTRSPIPLPVHRELCGFWESPRQS